MHCSKSDLGEEYLIPYFLLIAAFFHVFPSGCTDDKLLKTMTVRVGEDVKLTCPRNLVGTWLWFRFVPGDFPKLYSFNGKGGGVTKKEPGIFALYIKKAKQSDTAVYYCVKIERHTLIFLDGTNLRVEGKYRKHISDFHSYFVIFHIKVK